LVDRGLGCILALVGFVEVVDLAEDIIAFLFRLLRGFGLRCLCFLPLVPEIRNIHMIYLLRKIKNI
jgi:hypothetical protein